MERITTGLITNRSDGPPPHCLRVARPPVLTAAHWRSWWESWWRHFLPAHKCRGLRDALTVNWRAWILGWVRQVRQGMGVNGWPPLEGLQRSLRPARMYPQLSGDGTNS
jgi:hypothetical protein